MIKAIPAEYKGQLYKSRAEARWAVLFDLLGVKARYEHEGFQLPSGWYVPDFFIPDDCPIQSEGGSWIEVKGARPTEKEHKLCEELSKHTGQSVSLVSGYLDYPLRGTTYTGIKSIWITGTSYGPPGERLDNHGICLHEGNSDNQIKRAVNKAIKHSFWDPRSKDEIQAATELRDRQSAEYALEVRKRLMWESVKTPPPMREFCSVSECVPGRFYLIVQEHGGYEVQYVGLVGSRHAFRTRGSSELEFLAGDAGLYCENEA